MGNPGRDATCILTFPPADKSVTDRPFFGRVESLRGLGALAVAAFHIASWNLHGHPLLPDLAKCEPLRSVFRRGDVRLIPGHAALMMFFVISGFVLRISLAYGPRQPLIGAA